MDKTLISYWSKKAKNHNTEKSVSNHAIESELKFPRNSIVLDIGCGYGVESLYFLQKGHRVIGLDISTENLDITKNKATSAGFDIEICQTDLNSGLLPYEESSINIIYSRLSLHYFNLEKTIEIFKEILRVLTPGGKAFILMRAMEDEKEMKLFMKTATKISDGVYMDDGIVMSRFSNKQLHDICVNAGIKDPYIHIYKEDLNVYKETVKSSANYLILSEIIFTK